MTNHEMELRALDDRVQKLEIQNRRCKFGTLLLALVFASSLTMAMKSRHTSKPSVLRANTVETQNLEIKNANGKVLARFTVNPINDRATIKLYNSEGKIIWKAPGPVMVQ